MKSRSSPGAKPRMSLSCSASSSRVSGEQLDAAVARVALELGEQRPQRMASVQLVRPVGRDHEDALAAQRARQVDQEGARRAIGPVQVLDRDHQAVVAGEQLDQLEQRVEQACLGGRLVVGAAPRRARGGSAPACCGPHRRAARRPGRRRGPAGQRADHRCVGQLTLAQLDAVAADHAQDAVSTGRALGAPTAGGSLPTPDSPATERENDGRTTHGPTSVSAPAQLDELRGATDETWSS